MTELLEFYDRDDDNAHADFQRWRRQNYGNGLFLNYKGPSNTMLHRNSCPHLGDADWDRAEQGFGSLTSTKKICSTDRPELEQWAVEHCVVGVKRCQDCF